MPDLEEGEVLKSDHIDPNRHFTEAPPRYTEASLIKLLEEKGCTDGHTVHIYDFQFEFVK